MKKSFDYIIAGSGLGGLSLLYQLLTDDTLSKKDILVIDPQQKTQNDRTWCFWEKQAGPFESLVCRRWENLRFFSPDISLSFEMEEYCYKMIQSGDLYAHVLGKASGYDNVVFCREKITRIGTREGKAIVNTESDEYFADYVFNSTSIFNPEMNGSNTLLQHFLGWYIKTDKPVFDTGVGTLMDFRMHQGHGTTFMYVLPTGPDEALVEYTLFSEKTLKREEYIQELKKYIEDRLQIKTYEVTHKEFGVIPMTKASFKRFHGDNNRIINLGTAGGFTKPSTGYTFQFVQKHVMEVARRLKTGKSPAVKPSLREKMFYWYDMTLLDVLISGKLTGEQIFTGLFKNVPPERILAFLVNESGFWEEFRIRNSVPLLPFFMAGMKQFFVKS